MSTSYLEKYEQFLCTVHLFDIKTTKTDARKF